MRPSLEPRLQSRVVPRIVTPARMHAPPKIASREPEVIDIADEEDHHQIRQQQPPPKRYINEQGQVTAVRPMMPIRRSIRLPSGNRGYINVIRRDLTQGLVGRPVDRSVRYFGPNRIVYRRFDDIGLGPSPTPGYDADFRRIEASLIRAEDEKRKEIESQRLSTLSTYQARGVTGLSEGVLRRANYLLKAKSNLEPAPSDDEDAKDIKNMLSEVLDEVADLDKKMGWHRNILRKSRIASEIPYLNAVKPVPNIKRTNQRMLEQQIGSSMDLIRKFITKDRSNFELQVEFENHFVKRTRTGAISCYPYAQTFGRIGAEWPQEPESQESETKMEVMDASESRSSSTVASTPIMPEVKQEAALDSEEEYQNLPTSEFTSSRSPVRTSARQAPKTKRLSPGLEVSPSKSLVHSICVNGVSVISPIDVKEIRKSKPGRPSNKEKRKMQRHIDAQRKKLIKSGISQEGAIDFDVNACHCVCRQPYDAKKFYLACNRCKCWFHGKCIGLTEKKARKLKEWYCAECVPRSVKQKRMKKPISDDNTAEADEEKGLFCVCKQPYDSQKDYIGCDRCNDWFHFECVGVSAEMSKTMSEYLCPTCSGHTAMITEEEQEAICEAVQAMANDPDSGLFDKTSEEGKDFKQMVNDDVSLDEIYYKAFNKGYDCLREFVDEVSYIHAIVVSNSPPESQMCEVIKRLTTKASDILVQRLPDHEALSH